MTRPSPRLSIVVARRWRWDSTRAPAAARSALMTLNDSPSAASSCGPSASTRTARSPPAILRVASTRSSSGRRIVRISSVRNARTATSASPAPSTIASERRARAAARASSRASTRRALLAGDDLLDGAAHGRQALQGLGARRARAGQPREHPRRALRRRDRAPRARGSRRIAARERAHARGVALEHARGARDERRRRSPSPGARGWPRARSRPTGGSPRRPRARPSPTGCSRSPGGRCRAPRSRSRR